MAEKEASNPLKMEFQEERESDGPVRLNKFLADRGLYSRREADRLIAEGRVLVDGEPRRPGRRYPQSRMCV